MKLRHLLLVLFAAFTVLAACQEKEPDLSFPSIAVSQSKAEVDKPSSSFTVQLTANRAWRATSNVSWIAIDPDSGKASDKPQEVVITVQDNASFNRDGKVIFDIVYDSAQLMVAQAGNGSPEDYIIYFNDFDKETATQSYGSGGSSWPYLDQFDGWKNEKGVGAGNISYSFSNSSARNNSNSNGTYSDYDGSGINNILFGNNGYIAVKNIDLKGFKDIKLSFGSEKYDNNDKTALFKPEEFLVYASADGNLWVPVSYDYKGIATAGRWNIAEGVFSVPEGTATLNLYIKATVASAYRLDDLRLDASETPGTVLDFSQGTEINTGGSGSGGDDDYKPVVNAIYNNNFDKIVSTQTFGTKNNSWPYLDQFDGWKNETGTGAAGVSYVFSGMSARSNSNSNADYSDYGGSGANNLFFGKDAFFCVKSIALGGKTSFTLSFGTEKYDGSNKEARFDPNEMLVYVSIDGKKWAKLSYNFKGTAAGRWNLAEGSFSVPAGTDELNVYIKTTVASVYRLDDLTLAESSTSATELDFASGIEIDLSGGSSSGGGTGDDGGESGGDSGNIPFGKLSLSNFKEGAYVIAYTSGSSCYVMKNAVKATYYVEATPFDLSKGTAPAAEYQFTVRKSGGGYTIQNNQGTYVGVEVSGTHYNLKPAMSSAYIWSFAEGGNGAIIATGANSGGYCISYNGQYTEYSMYKGTDTCPTFYYVGEAIPGGGSGEDGGGEGDSGEDQGGVDDGTSVTWTVGSGIQKWNPVTDDKHGFGAGFKATAAGMTVAYYKDGSTTTPVTANADHIRVYKGSKLVISLDGGRSIKAVRLTCTESKYCTDCPVSDGSTATADTGTYTINWTGSTAEFIATAANSQIRIKEIKVTYK